MPKALHRTISRASAPALPAPQEMAALVRRAADGDVAAFERLAAAYHPKVYSFALSFTADHDAASDLAQEALIKVYRAIGGYRFESSFTTWLFRIVKNAFLDALKSRAHRERAMEEELGEGDVELLREAAVAEDRLVEGETRRALWKALGEVPETYRMVLVLFDVEGLSYDEIAKVLDVPVGTVKSRLNRGRDALREAVFRSKDLVER